MSYVDNHVDSLDVEQSGCPFCRIRIEGRVIAELGAVVAILDKNPVTSGHILVIPKRHTHDWFSMNEAEKRDADNLLLLLRDQAMADDPGITGFNIGCNCGASAGQTIDHAHIHLIPRRDGDTPQPMGGVRGVIPGKRAY